VVIAFHGSSKIGMDVDGFAMEADTRLSLPIFTTKYSDSKIFVYPNGVGGTWAGPSYAKVSVDEDIQFVKDLLVDLHTNFSVDSKRIYATGLSNGGGFVGVIACSDVSAHFAALAPVAGAFYTDINGPNNGCAPGRTPLPLLEIHGGSDKTVNYTGGTGEGGQLPSITDWLNSWAQRDGCTTKKAEDSDNGNVHHYTWTCNGVEGALQHWKVDSMDHYWPSKSLDFSMIAAGAGPQPIEANDIIIGFFEQFSLD